jgi:hypothetical protein
MYGTSILSLFLSFSTGVRHIPDLLFAPLMFYSLYLRDVIRHDYRPDQSVVVIFLSPRVSQEILSHRLLDNNGILRL